jgi:predicted MarR family transcription regulator
VATTADRSVGPIVSSAHLVSEKAAELSELEFGLTIANNAFHRWMAHCMAASGIPDLSPLDILVLHSVNHRGRPKKLADICFILNIEDSHTVTYALKKLAKLSLVAGERKTKEKLFSTTKAGQDACQRYREIREECLVKSLSVRRRGGRVLVVLSVLGAITSIARMGWMLAQFGLPAGTSPYPGPACGGGAGFGSPPPARRGRWQDRQADALA